MISKCIDHGMVKSISPEGYGLVTDPRYKQRCTRIHRIKYAEKMNTDLDGIVGVVVRHTCDNPRCINPNHLIGGTKADNNRDRAERGRSAKRVPSRQRLTKADCDFIIKHTKNRCPTNGVLKMAQRFNVDPAVIVKVRKGEYCVQQDE